MNAPLAASLESLLARVGSPDLLAQSDALRAYADRLLAAINSPPRRCPREKPLRLHDAVALRVAGAVAQQPDLHQHVEATLRAIDRQRADDNLQSAMAYFVFRVRRLFARRGLAWDDAPKPKPR